MPESTTFKLTIAYDGTVPGWGHALQKEGVRVESIGKLHYRKEADATGFDRQIIACREIEAGSARRLIRGKRDSGVETADANARHDASVLRHRSRR